MYYKLLLDGGCNFKLSKREHFKLLYLAIKNPYLCNVGVGEELKLLEIILIDSSLQLEYNRSRLSWQSTSRLEGFLL